MSHLYEKIGGQNAVTTLVKNVYEKMRDDYRISRFFNDSDKPEQIKTLTDLASAILKGQTNGSEFTALISRFFMAAFARFKGSERLPESGFAYLGIIIAQDNPSSKYLCDSHSHLLKFIPNDTHYDVVIEHLAQSLKELNIDGVLSNEILALAEKGRNSILGK